MNNMFHERYLYSNKSYESSERDHTYEKYFSTNIETNIEKYINEIHMGLNHCLRNNLEWTIIEPFFKQIVYDDIFVQIIRTSTHRNVIYKDIKNIEGIEDINDNDLKLIGNYYTTEFLKYWVEKKYSHILLDPISFRWTIKYIPDKLDRNFIITDRFAVITENNKHTINIDGIKFISLPLNSKMYLEIMNYETAESIYGEYTLEDSVKLYYKECTNLEVSRINEIQFNSYTNSIACVDLKEIVTLVKSTYNKEPLICIENKKNKRI